LNAALIRALHSASDAQRLEGGAAPPQQQGARGLASPFLNYAADILRPEHVARLSDTTLELRLPPCTAALGAVTFERCSRVTDETAFGSVEEIAFVVPSAAAASSSGCLVARPFLRVYGTVPSVRLSLHRDAAFSSLPDGTNDVTIAATAQQNLVPLRVYLHARCGSWDNGLVRASGEIARPTGGGIPTAVGELVIINSTVAALTLVGATRTAESDGPSFVTTRIVVRPEWLVADRSLAAMLTPTAARNVTVETVRTVTTAPTFAWLWPRR
jgi:hypothetical protein